MISNYQIHNLGRYCEELGGQTGRLVCCSELAHGVEREAGGSEADEGVGYDDEESEPLLLGQQQRQAELAQVEPRVERVLSSTVPS